MENGDRTDTSTCQQEEEEIPDPGSRFDKRAVIGRELIKAYKRSLENGEQKLSLKVWATRFGVGTGTVRKILTEAGIYKKQKVT